MTEDNPQSKPRFEDCKALADYWADGYERRRAVEWKVSLGTWAVLLTSIRTDKLHFIFGWAFVLFSVCCLLDTWLWHIPINLKREG